MDDPHILSWLWACNSFIHSYLCQAVLATTFCSTYSPSPIWR